MQALLTNLTACSLFIHALVGCCWSHAHERACQAESNVRATADATSDCATSDVAACCHHCHQACERQLAHGHAGDERSIPPAPCNCKFECHGVCTYLPPEKPPLENLAAAPTFDLPVLTIDQGYAAILCDGYWEWLADSGAATAPLRLHLLHQVFLI